MCDINRHMNGLTCFSHNGGDYVKSYAIFWKITLKTCTRDTNYIRVTNSNDFFSVTVFMSRCIIETHAKY